MAGRWGDPEPRAGADREDCEEVHGGLGPRADPHGQHQAPLPHGAGTGLHATITTSPVTMPLVTAPLRNGGGGGANAWLQDPRTPGLAPGNQGCLSPITFLPGLQWPPAPA